jgi:hypothetical protein
VAEFRGQDLQGSSFVRVSLSGSSFTRVDLSGARIRSTDVSGAVLRGVDVNGLELDAPWLYDGSLVVNGIDVVGFVEAELNCRFPGRSERRAADPDELRSAWAALEQAWTAVTDRVAALPEGTSDASVAEEWSFSQTLRHLVLATDMWLGKAVLGRDRPFHSLGLIDSDSADGFDLTGFATDTPSYSEVLLARGDRMAMVRSFLATVTAEQLADVRRNPHVPEQPETVLSCLHTILEEEWEHQRYAVRDLDQIVADDRANHIPA